MKRSDPIITKINQGPWLYFIVTYAWSWIFWIPAALSGEDVLSFPYIILLGLGGLGPAVAGISLTYLKEDKEVRYDYWRRVVDVKCINLKWLSIILLSAPVFCTLGIITGIVLNGEYPSLDTAFELLANPVGLILYMFFIFIYGPLPEEVGWRGYVLDRLQKKWSALYSSLILGILWGIWHWPMFFMVGTYQSVQQPLGSIRFFVDFWIAIIANTILITWVYNNTERSTLSATLYHFIMNFTGLFLGLTSVQHIYKAIWTAVFAGFIVKKFGLDNQDK
ncbi:MAG: CPBP family intramembrane glutamic endopeptidase [Candidatus Hodarchaeales archaeon]